MIYQEHCTGDFTREISNKYIELGLTEHKKYYYIKKYYQRIFGFDSHLLSSFLLAQFNLNLLAWIQINKHTQRFSQAVVLKLDHSLTPFVPGSGWLLSLSRICLVTIASLNSRKQ